MLTTKLNYAYSRFQWNIAQKIQHDCEKRASTFLRRFWIWYHRNLDIKPLSNIADNRSTNLRNVLKNFTSSVLCMICFERAWELNNYSGKLQFQFYSTARKCELISETRKSLIVLKYCHSLITLNGSLRKISLKWEYSVCHWFRPTITRSPESLVPLPSRWFWRERSMGYKVTLL